jgi:hypothetical protein
VCTSVAGFPGRPDGPDRGLVGDVLGPLLFVVRLRAGPCLAHWRPGPGRSRCLFTLRGGFEADLGAALVPPDFGMHGLRPNGTGGRLGAYRMGSSRSVLTLSGHQLSLPALSPCELLRRRRRAARWEPHGARGSCCAGPQPSFAPSSELTVTVTWPRSSAPSPAGAAGVNEFLHSAALAPVSPNPT